MTESVNASESQVAAKPTPIPDPAPHLSWWSMATVVCVASWLSGLIALVVGLVYGSLEAKLAGAGCEIFSLAFYLAVYSRSRLAKTARKVVVKLPVLRDPDVQRIGAMAGVAARTCARCAAFDLPAGQHALATHGDFKMAAAYLRPNQMMKTSGGAWSEDRGFDDRGQPVDEGGPSWSDMGACRKLGKLVFRPQTCEKWS